MFGALVQVLKDYPALISFLASFIFGEETIMLLGISTSQGVFSFWTLVIFALLGFVAADSMWFFLGRLKFLSFLKKYNWLHRGYRKAGDVIDKVTNKSVTLTLITVKSFYGASVLTLMHMGRNRKIEFKSFLIGDIISSGIWVLIAASVGWLAGRGFTFLLTIFQNFQVGITLLILVFLLFYIIRKWMNKILRKELKK